MKMESNWENSSATLSQRMKYERTLNFTTMPHEEEEFGFSRKKISRDPMSHRIIEKRRRDRMNNCLADLSRLIPIVYLKKGRGRIEKTEIIELATKHLKHLQSHACKDPATCEVVQNLDAQDSQKHHRMGYQECTSETVRFLVETEGFYPNEGVCLRLINHLQEHYDKLVRAGSYEMNKPNDDDLNMLMDVESLGLTTTKQNEHPSPAPTPTPDQNKRPLTPSFSSSDQHSLDSNPHLMMTYIENTANRPNSKPNYNSEEICSSQPSSTLNKHQLGNRLQIAESVKNTYNPINSESSQLRDILKSPISTNKRMRSNSNTSTLSNASNYNMVSNQFVLNKTVDEVYKFKNNIKERFNADLSHDHIDDVTSIERHKGDEAEHSQLATSSGHSKQYTQRKNETGFEFPNLFSNPNVFRSIRGSRVSAPEYNNNSQDICTRVSAPEYDNKQDMCTRVSAPQYDNNSQVLAPEYNNNNAKDCTRVSAPQYNNNSENCTRVSAPQFNPNNQDCTRVSAPKYNNNNQACTRILAPEYNNNNQNCTRVSAAHYKQNEDSNNRLNIKTTNNSECQQKMDLQENLKRLGLAATDTQMDSNNSNSSCDSPNSGSHFNGSTSGYSTQGDKCDLTIKGQVNEHFRESYIGEHYKIMNKGTRLSNNETTGVSSNAKTMATGSGRTLVPVFALHPKGKFYVALTLDTTILEGYFGDIMNDDASLLHPVSISVNFCRRNLNTATSSGGGKEISVKYNTWQKENDFEDY